MSIAKHWINIDELIDSLKGKLEPSILAAIKDKIQSPFLTNEELLMEIEQLLPDKLFVKFVAKVKKLTQTRYSGIPHAKGIKEYIPPLKENFDVTWKVDEDKISLTGFQVQTTGWKPNDAYTLRIKHFKRGITGNIINIKTIELFKNIPFKENGEHKSFRIPYNYSGSPKILKDDEVILTIHNRSGNSRQLYLDLEYLIGTASEVIPPGDTAFFLDTTDSMVVQLHPGSEFSQRLPNYLMDVGANGDMIYTFFFGDISDHAYEYTYCGGKTVSQTIDFFSNTNNIAQYGGVGCPRAGLKIVGDKYGMFKNLSSILIVTDCPDITDTIKNKWQEIKKKKINIYVYIPKEVLSVYKPLENIELLQIIGTF